MLFPTLRFGLFFLVVFALSWTTHRRHRLHKWTLTAASFVFYAAWDWRFTALLAFSGLWNYAAGRLLGRRPDRRLVALAVAVNLALLAFFKYWNFLLAQLAALLLPFGLEPRLPFLEIVLPVGISFFTFHGISYIVDVYRGKVPAARDPVDVLLYISFFPQLVAGPIVRASFFLPQLATPPDPARIEAGPAFLLILGGLFKKVVLANYLATDLVDPVFEDPSACGAGDLILAMYGYALQIYCDFSAYTDIATGVARLLGYRFPENFNQPYRAASFQEFWRRWHISLSSWLRDYLYILGLGGNRRGAVRTYVNLIVTMLLGGVWHGANLTFVLWGAIHGTALAVERRLGGGERTTAGEPAWRHALRLVVVFHVVCLAWVLFRSATITDALAWFRGIGQWQAPTRLSPLIALLLVLGALTQVVPPGWTESLRQRFGRLPGLGQGLAVGLAIVLIDALGPDGVPPFIYFQF